MLSLRRKAPGTPTPYLGRRKLGRASLLSAQGAEVTEPPGQHSQRGPMESTEISTHSMWCASRQDFLQGEAREGQLLLERHRPAFPGGYKEGGPLQLRGRKTTHPLCPGGGGDTILGPDHRDAVLSLAQDSPRATESAPGQR